MKRGDTAPPLGQTLVGTDRVAEDLTGYQEVSFYMRDSDKNVVISDDTSGQVSVDDAANGKVSYSWQSGDTDQVGYYEAEWEVVFSDTTVQSYPNDDYIVIEFFEDIE